jgi:hypothetical protein
MKFIKLNILVMISLSLLINACSNSSSTANGSSGSDTVFFKLSSSVSTEEQIFNYAKTGEWKPVYVFQIDDEDDYGYKRWRNFFVINDFTEEEFNEMKKYANITSFLEKCPNARSMYTTNKVNK